MRTVHLPRHSRGRTAARGFTLIEVLIVMVLMALLTAAAMTTINYAINDQDAQTEARRIAALARLAGEEAMLTGREYGLRIGEENLRFYIFDDESRQWLPLEDDETFRPRPRPEDLQFDLVLEGQAITLADADEEEDLDQPQLMFFSSGEITPFTLTISEFDGTAWNVEGDMLGRYEITQVEQ